MTERELFDVPAIEPAPEPKGPPVKMTATDVKDALRRRHPSDDNRGGLVGQWTCIEEWRNIDLLALNAWQKGDVIGYEVKVSRSDMRQELLRPAKRVIGVDCTTEFYFAVPAGLLTAAEIAYEEPEWELDDFERTMCPGVAEFGGLAHGHARHQRWGGECHRQYGRVGESRYGRYGAHVVRVPVPEVVVLPDWFGHAEQTDAERAARYLSRCHESPAYAECWNCGGKGYLAKSRVELEAPTLWVPSDVGLVTVSARGCTVVKKSPRRTSPEPIAAGRRSINDLVRWVSHRPDARHRRCPTEGGAA